MTIEKIKEYLDGTKGPKVLFAADLVKALYDGEIYIEEAITFPSVKTTAEYKETIDKIYTALFQMYSRDEAIDLFEKYNEFDVERIDTQNRFCFEQGIKIGIAMAEILNQSR